MSQSLGNVIVPLSARQGGPGDPTLAVFACAGAGLLRYANLAKQAQSVGLSVIGIQRPSRENRFADSPCNNISVLIDEAYHALEPYEHLSLFGHSFGGLIAHGVAQRRTRSDRLILAASLPPDHKNPEIAELAFGEDKALVAWMQRLGSLPDSVIQNTDAISVFLPALRADLQALALCHIQAGQRHEPFDGPTTLVCGRYDTYASPDDISGWQNQLVGKAEKRVIDGGHFFPFDPPSGLISILG